MARNCIKQFERKLFWIKQLGLPVKASDYENQERAKAICQQSYLD